MFFRTGEIHGDRVLARTVNSILTMIGALEMDLLDQHSIRCYLPGHGAYLPSIERDPRLDQAKVTARRLAWQCHANSCHNLYPHSHHLGWHPVSLELVGDTGTTDTWVIWHCGILLV